MTFSIKLKPEGQDVLTSVLPTMDSRFLEGIRAALLQGGRALVRGARDGMILERKTGVLYRIGPGQRRQLRIFKKQHKASSEGQYPAILTGQTVNGIDYEIRGSSQLVFGIRDRKDRGPIDLPTFLEKTRPTLALTDKAKSKDLYNWLRRLPHQRMTQK